MSAQCTTEDGRPICNLGVLGPLLGVSAVFLFCCGAAVALRWRRPSPSAIAPAPLDHLWLSTLPAASKRWLGSNVARVMDVQGARVMDVQGAMIKLPISEAYARGVLPPPSPPVSPDDHASRVHQVL